MMDNFKYDSYCGIYCGACDILMSYKTGTKRKLAAFWNKSTVKKYQTTIGGTTAAGTFDIQCHGCKSNQLFINCSTCKVRACAIAKKVEHCIDCTEYPCQAIQAFQKGEAVLSHLKHNRENLGFIKQNGVRAWLADQEKKWQCPGCQTGFSWYTPKCPTCGNDLKGKSHTLSFIKFLLLKLNIYLAPNKKQAAP